jgi:hypothetical protein
MSTGSRQARIRGGADDKNIGYPRQRTVTPPGNSSSSDQPELPGLATAG